jgi:hypothetical protein
VIHYATTQVPLGGALVKAEIDATETADTEGVAGWRVVVLIDRPAGEPSIQAGDLRAQLLDDQGKLPVLAEPSQEWVEAGGAAGTTASAAFEFGARNGPLGVLVISWAGEEVSLALP